jgi:hypothetical protein
MARAKYWKARLSRFGPESAPVPVRAGKRACPGSGRKARLSRFGPIGMPPLFAYEDPDGVLEISDGVTRATRIAKLCPGETVPVIVIGHYRRSRASSPRVRDRL